MLPKDLATRETLRKQIRPLLATGFSKVRGRVKLLPNGPPALSGSVQGWWALIRWCCADWPIRSNWPCRANTNTRGVNDNWNRAVKVLRLDVDQAKARALG